MIQKNPLSRYTVKASTMNKDGLGPLCCVSMLLHHLVTPGRLASQVEAMYAVLSTCFDELASVEMVRSRKGNDTSGLLDHFSQGSVIVLAAIVSQLPCFIFVLKHILNLLSSCIGACQIFRCKPYDRGGETHIGTSGAPSSLRTDFILFSDLPAAANLVLPAEEQLKR